MKKVFNSIDDVSKLFIAQTQDFAGTPYTHIDGRGKGRRFYFKGNTIYSYRDNYPLAKIVENKLFVIETPYSITTAKHRTSVIRACDNLEMVLSNDFKKGINIDHVIKKLLKLIFNTKKYYSTYKDNLNDWLKNTDYSFTKSKFPLLFDKKHNKLKQMFFSNDVETFNLAKQLIKQEKLI